MVIQLKYVKHLLTIYAKYASEVNQRSNEVTEVKRSNPFKTLLLLYFTSYGHVTKVYKACTQHVCQIFSLS